MYVMNGKWPNIVGDEEVAQNLIALVEDALESSEYLDFIFVSSNRYEEVRFIQENINIAERK